MSTGRASERVGALIARTDEPLDVDLAERQDAAAGGREGVHLPTFGHEATRLDAARSGRGARITADLPPGGYLLVVRAELDGPSARGEAFCGFDLAVGEKEGYS